MVPRNPEQRSNHRIQKRRPSSGYRRSKRLEQAVEARQSPSLHRLPSPPSDQSLRVPKRKALPGSEHSTFEVPPYKKSRTTETTSPSYHSITGSDSQYGQEVHWKEYFGDWPLSAMQQSVNTREPRAPKRSHTPSQTNSYSQQVRDGESPVAWTRKHEEKMEEAGLFMTPDRTQATITEQCQKLCDKLLTTDYDMPEGPVYQQDRVAKVLRRVRFRNEARVVRDVTPLVVPSPELLVVDGLADLGNVCEAMNAEWTQCDTLCGPRPKPDFVGGISTAAFTQEEKQKLQMSHTSACPNLFPESMYFPFLICEVKGSDRPIEEAERQAMHSASIAARAVIELFRKVSATAEVHQKILGFSVAHNHSMVMIFAHFATVNDQQTSFFRRLLHLHRFAEDLESTAWTKAYKIIRAIYEHFVPQHLARIQSALSRMRSPSLASFTTQLGIDEDSQASTTDQSLQEDGIFKKPSLPSTIRLQEENDKLRDKLLDLLREQQAEASRRREEEHERKAMMEKQLAQQKEQMEKQLAQQKEQLEEQLAQQKEQKEQMAEQLAQQKQQMERQFAQQEEIITLLKMSKGL